MGSLTHVSYRSSHGWVRITAEEASKLYSSGAVHANSGLFVCDLCRQYVTLTGGHGRIRYFKHSRGEVDKSCPERTFGTSYNSSYIPEEHELPIRIQNVESGSFYLEMGLICVPKWILQKQEKQYVIIKPQCNETISYDYSFERLNPDTISYVSIGNIPAKNYQIETGEDVHQYWPKIIHGISQDGRLFDSASHKMMTDDADIIIGRKYFLLCERNIFYSENDISIKKICEKKVENGTWRIYEIIAISNSDSAARFFWDLNYRLTDSPITMQPVWPVYVEKPYIIQHNEDQMFLHILNGKDALTRTYPSTDMNEVILDSSDGRVFEFTCADRMELITTGRTKVLQYLYYWKEKLDRQIMQAPVIVKDKLGNSVLPGISNNSNKSTIIITVPFDGKVVIKNNGIILEKHKLFASSSMKIENLHYGSEVVVLQGLDAVWSLKLEKIKKSINESLYCEMDILERLSNFHGESMPIPSSMSGLIERLSKYPSVKKWVYRQILAGSIQTDAWRYLRSIL